MLCSSLAIDLGCKTLERSLVQESVSLKRSKQNHMPFTYCVQWQQAHVSFFWLHSLMFIPVCCNTHESKATQTESNSLTLHSSISYRTCVWKVVQTYSRGSNITARHWILLWQIRQAWDCTHDTLIQIDYVFIKIQTCSLSTEKNTICSSTAI